MQSARVRLPRQLKIRPIIDRLSAAALDLRSCQGTVVFDFCDVEFAEPTGIVLLHNLTHYLHGRGCRVEYAGCSAEGGPAIRFMDDIGFFEDQLGERLSPASRHRPTTLRLREIHQADAATWINSTFVPWLANCSGRSQASLGSLGTCMSEIFNNIRDHAGTEVGSIFGQWFPKVERLRIAISDMGRGIPDLVQQHRPDLSPQAAIKEAFKLGFSTMSNPRNRGAGLDFLLTKVCMDLKGSLTVYSGRHVAHADDGGQLKAFNAMLSDIGYTGTLFDIVMPTTRIAAEVPDTEVEVW